MVDLSNVSSCASNSSKEMGYVCSDSFCNIRIRAAVGRTPLSLSFSSHCFDYSDIFRYFASIMELPEEQNKLKEIAAGNVEAFEHLFFQYQPRLVNFLIGLTHDKEVSRDMAQDLFLSLWNDRE